MLAKQITHKAKMIYHHNIKTEDEIILTINIQTNHLISVNVLNSLEGALKSIQLYEYLKKND